MDERLTAFIFKTWVDVANSFPTAEQFKEFFNMIFEYQFEWKLPDEKTDPIMKAFFQQIKRSIDKRNWRNQKISNSMKWNQNAVKSFENISKQMKTDENSWQQIKQKNKNKSKSKNKKENKTNNNQIEFDKISDEILIDPKNEIKEIEEKKEYWNSLINELINELKKVCNEIWVAYDKNSERNFAHHIMTAKEFGEFCNKVWQSRIEFAKNVLKASVQIWYWKGACSWPKKIYQNYSDIFNEVVKMKNKQQKTAIPKF